VLSYFLPAVLTTAGYTDGISQANINVSVTCFGLFCSVIGASTVDRFGRRPLMIFGMVASSLVWVGMTASTGVYSANPEDRKAAQAAIVMVFLFVFAYATGITPLQSLYPVEVLSYEMRAKGMAFSSLAQNAAGLLNQFAWPIALKAIGWRTYIVFIVWDLIQAAVFYFFLPETKNRTVSLTQKTFSNHTDVILA
jgi:MFS family permease